MLMEKNVHYNMNYNHQNLVLIYSNNNLLSIELFDLNNLIELILLHFSQENILLL